MSKKINYPIFFEPDFKERIWGGEKLKTVFGKNIPNNNTGESWEIACHKNGQSIVKNGEYKGLTLEKLLLKKGEEVIGESFGKDDKFPLLIKFIDAKDKLSVQVHPENDYAFIHENGEFGKNEAWYILQANEGAKVIAGLKDSVTKELFKEKLKENKLEDVLNEIKVKAGDVIEIPAGLIHTIGKGILLAEVQQNSDITYRVYDWARKDKNGNYRQLHVERSLDVIDFEQKHSKELVKGELKQFKGYKLTEFVRNKYFVIQELDIDSEYISKEREPKFEIYMCVEGNGEIICDTERHNISLGDTFLIPYTLEEYIINKNNNLKLVKTFLTN